MLSIVDMFVDVSPRLLWRIDRFKPITIVENPSEMILQKPGIPLVGDIVRIQQPEFSVHSLNHLLVVGTARRLKQFVAGIFRQR